MKITNEFTVHTPIDRAWQVLTDLPGIAPCLPGAQLTGVDGDVHQGKVKVKVGPVISDFSGTARFTEKDDEAHRAVIDAKGRDARAGGNASALVTAVLRPDGDSTVVSVDTDLKISGKLAQFGSGMIKEISGKLLAQFVTNLEAKLAADQSPVNGGPADSPANGDVRAESPAGSDARAESPANDGAPAAAATTPSAAAATTPSAAATTTPSAAAVETVPATAAVVAPGVPGPKPGPQAPSAASLTADLVPADPGAAEPATPAVAGSEPLAATTTDPSGVTSPPATTSPPAPPTAPADPGAPIRDPHEAASPENARAGRATTTVAAPRSAVPATEEPEALDLLAVAGGSVYKRLVPLGVIVAALVALIAWLVGRR
ncbi:SRPBCC domain-containing protein [Actinoplanes sp. M2I2]|uniref:SRPBCC domain-containing protein n=1 Tax=Actinoplanes sp. M2I2 TaxID=1734444 RepID=UPI002020A7DC|nr:SRPBCC domain-containing protein [Actinoplanes sp. M2I2]